MRFCLPHWNSLRQKLDAAGIVYSNGRDELLKLDDVEDDPLIRAHNAIIYNCVEAFGRQAFTEEAEACPICKFDVESWIDETVQDRISERARLN